MSDVLLSAFFWGTLGAVLGLSNIWLQNFSMSKAGNITDRKMITEFSLYSVLRIVLALIILFFAFKNGLAAGLSCLGAFIITRWVGLAVFLIKNKERS